MGLFGATPPKRVTGQEMKEIQRRLYDKLDDDEQNELEKLFRADLLEPGTEAGISKQEFDAGIAWLEQNLNKHELEPDDIEVIKKYFAEHLED